MNEEMKQLIIRHIRDHNTIEPELVQKWMKIYPEYIYNGLGYRSFGKLSSEIERNQTPTSSWSKSKYGAGINNQKMSDEFCICSQNIKGFDLHQFIEYSQEVEILKLDYQFEKEILVPDIIELLNFEDFSIRDYFFLIFYNNKYLRNQYQTEADVTFFKERVFNIINQNPNNEHYVSIRKKLKYCTHDVRHFIWDIDQILEEDESAFLFFTAQELEMYPEIRHLIVQE